MTILGDPESSRHQNYSAFDTNGTPDAIQALASSKTELKRRVRKVTFHLRQQIALRALLAEWNIKRLQQVICPAFTNSIFRLEGSRGVIFLLLDF